MQSALTYQMGISRIDDMHRQAAERRLTAQARRARPRLRLRSLPTLGVAVQPRQRLA